jgi:hypothetical protein
MNQVFIRYFIEKIHTNHWALKAGRLGGMYFNMLDSMVPSIEFVRYIHNFLNELEGKRFMGREHQKQCTLN